MGRTGAREVELVEEAADEPAPPRPPRRGRRWMWLVVVLVVALAVGAQATLDARGRTRDAMLAALPGTLAPVGDRLHALWAVPSAVRPVLASGLEVDDAFVGARRMSDGSFDAMAIDAASGATRWVAPLQASSDARAVGVDPFCVPGDATAPTPTLQCLVQVSTESARLVTIDARNGAMLSGVDVARADALAVDGPTTYLAAVDGSGGCVVSALVGAAVRWGTDAPCSPGASLVAAGGIVAVGTPEGRTTVLSADGATLGAAQDAAVQRIGDLLVVSSRASGAATSTLFHAGRAPVTVAGTVMAPQVDDGSAKDVVVTADRDARGYDATSGRRLWRVPLALSGGYLVRGGSIVSSSSEDLLVEIDARRGTVHHRAAVQRDALAMPPVTDGPRFLTVVLGAPSEPAKLIGIAAAGGLGVTPVGLPVGLLDLRQVGRHLLGSDLAGSVFVLG